MDFSFTNQKTGGGMIPKKFKNMLEGKSIAPENALLRCLWSFAVGVGRLSLAFLGTGLVIVILLWPMLLAEAFNNGNYFWGYLVHLTIMLYWLGEA